MEKLNRTYKIVSIVSIVFKPFRKQEWAFLKFYCL